MKNQEWLARSQTALWHPCTQMKWHERHPQIPISRAEGCWLEDFDGNRYLDGISSWWVNLFGHRHPGIVAALKEQLDILDHVMLAGLTHSTVVELSERLSGLTQGALGHCFYGSDGASATEVALKMSAHYWKNHGHPAKSGFVALAGSYHGETLGSLGVTDIPLFREAYADLIRGCAIIPGPDERAGEEAAQRSLEALARYLEQHHNRTAALIMEPLVQAAAGMVFHAPGFVQQASRLCHEYGVHLIADEIAVGFGRTGTFFAHEQAGIRPDFLCLSKGITGGFLPLSVVMTTHDVFDAFYDDQLDRGFLHSHSYTGNPLACRAALTVLDIFRDEKVLESNQVKQEQWRPLFESLSGLSVVRNLRQRGMIWAFDVVTERSDFSMAFHRAALDEGLLLRPIGRTVYFMPPYVINEDEFRFMIDKVHVLLSGTLPS